MIQFITNIIVKGKWPIVFHYLIFNKPVTYVVLLDSRKLHRSKKPELHSSLMVILMWLYCLAKEVKSALMAALT